MTRLTIGSLFSGIGGLELGLEWSGLGPVLWQVELDRYCRRVLARHWPDARRLTHVQAVPAAARAARLPRVDILCGGFPCQDISQANPDGRGLDGERSGLFWWALDCVDALKPSVVVVENVGRLAGRDLDRVRHELVRRGFKVEATTLSAARVGAPQRRDRIFVVAYADGVEPERRREPGILAGPQRPIEGEGVQRKRDGYAAGDSGGVLGDSDGFGSQGIEHAGATPRTVDRANRTRIEGSPQPRVGRGSARVPAGLDGARWPAPRGAGQHPWEPARVRPRQPGDRARLKALGNAVVPWCAYVVGMRIRQRIGEQWAGGYDDDSNAR